MDILENSRSLAKHSDFSCTLSILYLCHYTNYTLLFSDITCLYEFINCVSKVNFARI